MCPLGDDSAIVTAQELGNQALGLLRRQRGPETRDGVGRVEVPLVLGQPDEIADRRIRDPRAA